MNSTSSPEFHPDILGNNFEAATLELGRDPEGEGEVVATVVRYTPSIDPERTAIVWVHGLSDYFFQSHVAQAFDDAGYAFYAVDLRKCGRSLREGQTAHYAESMNCYFPDLTAALDVITGHGHSKVVFLPHSTGGLIVPLWMDHLRRSGDARHKSIVGLVLNSPWLDLQFPAPLAFLMRTFLPAIGRRFPHLALRGAGFSAYGESIHKDHHGEWDFDITLKPMGGVPLYAGWLRAILAGQKQLHDGGVDVGVPVLTLRSSDTYHSSQYSAATDTADVVLEVDQIAKRAPLLGRDVTVSTIDGARHDISLSLRQAREEALKVTLTWLDKNVD